MIQTRKRLLVVDVSLSRRLSKSLAFCEFASVNFNDAKQPPKVNFARIQFSSLKKFYIFSSKWRGSPRETPGLIRNGLRQYLMYHEADPG